MVRQVAAEQRRRRCPIANQLLQPIRQSLRRVLATDGDLQALSLPVLAPTGGRSANASVPGWCRLFHGAAGRVLLESRRATTPARGNAIAELETGAK